jgi:trehalose utilization protein
MESAMPPRITIWNEFRHEKQDEKVRAIYPEGMHQTLKAAILRHLPSAEIRTATLDEPDHGLTESTLEQTDVLVWWGHRAHIEVRDDIVERVHQRVLAGMGILFLHSAHYSKPFIKLMGTGCGLRWREAGELERLFVVDPSHPIADGIPPHFEIPHEEMSSHPIADGIPPHFEIPHEEMYGEFFDIPTPENLVLVSWFQGGNIFRSCCTWTRGKGKVVYFRPGHETYPTYHQPEVQRVIANAANWAASRSSQPYSFRAQKEPTPLSPLPPRV